MNIDAIIIDRDTAETKLREYAGLPQNARTIEDELLRDVYRAAARGERVINAFAAFRTTGLNERGEPRLGMARADWAGCFFHPNSVIGGGYAPRGGLFTGQRRFSVRLRVNCFSLPQGTFSAQLTREGLYSPLPYIPPQIRPRPSALSRSFVLFEVERWQQYPVDPFLLRHIAGPFYAVEAEWQLTALEASLLSALAD